MMTILRTKRKEDKAKDKKKVEGSKIESKNGTSKIQFK